MLAGTLTYKLVADRANGKTHHEVGCLQSRVANIS